MGLAFILEQDVSECFISLMIEFPEQEITVAKYFVEKYIKNGSMIKVDESPNFPLKF